MPSPSVHVPDKLYFRIGEVARLAGVEAYVLRFWETAFPALKPVKSSTGQRLYRRREVEMVLHIKKLLYEQGFTIAGARKQLKQTGRKQQPAMEFSGPQKDVPVAAIRRELKEILLMLNRKQSV